MLAQSLKDKHSSFVINEDKMTLSAGKISSLPPCTKQVS